MLPTGHYTDENIPSSNPDGEEDQNLPISGRPSDFIRLLPAELRIWIYDMLIYSEHTIHITPFRQHQTALTGLASLAQTCYFFRIEMAYYIRGLAKMEGLVNSPVFGWICPERTTFIVPPRGWQYDPSSVEWTHKAATFKSTSKYPSPPKRKDRARVFHPSHPCHTLIAFEAWQTAMNSSGTFVEEMFNDILYYHPCFGYYRRVMGTLEKLEWS